VQFAGAITVTEAFSCERDVRTGRVTNIDRPDATADEWRTVGDRRDFDIEPASQRTMSFA